MMEKFFTAQKSSEGIDLPLFLPGTDIKTEHSIKVRGTDSEEFRIAKIVSDRELRNILSEDLKDADRKFLDGRRKLIASLVISWTFDQECTLENVIEFFRKAPQVEEAVNQVSARRSLFFANGSKNSVNTPEPSSN